MMPVPPPYSPAALPCHHVSTGLPLIGRARKSYALNPRCSGWNQTVRPRGRGSAGRPGSARSSARGRCSRTTRSASNRHLRLRRVEVGRETKWFVPANDRLGAVREAVLAPHAAGRACDPERDRALALRRRAERSRQRAPSPRPRSAWPGRSSRPCRPSAARACPRAGRSSSRRRRRRVSSSGSTPRKLISLCARRRPESRQADTPPPRSPSCRPRRHGPGCLPAGAGREGHEEQHDRGDANRRSEPKPSRPDAASTSHFTGFP